MPPMAQRLSKPPQAVPTLPHRMGPRPFGLHLMMGLCASLSLPFMLPSLRNESASSNPGGLKLPPEIQNLLPKGHEAEFDAALSQAAILRARNFIAGLKTYQQHQTVRDIQEMPVVWQQGTTRLRDYNRAAPDAPVILVIPSLINRFTILDLDLAPSFLRALAAAGFRPLVVDWDEPGKIESSFALNDYVQRLARIMDWLRPKGADIHLIGYCMGGLLSLALATLRISHIKTLTLLATPWDFHQPDRTVADMLDALWGDGTSWASDGMPVEIIQTLFAMLQPFQAVTKFVDFAALNPASNEARQFVLLEDWLNDGVPLTTAAARECFKDWYGANLTASFAWRVGGQVVDPRKLLMPSYVVVPGRDRIVPEESALPLAKLLPHATLHQPMTGHIGIIASRHASHQVWRPLLHWLQEHR